MAPFGTIYNGYPNNMRVQRALVAAAFSKLEVVEAPLIDLFKPRPAEFLTKFPMNKVPAFEGADGFKITEGGAIVLYLMASGPNRERFLGSSCPKTEAGISQWALFADGEIFNNMGIVTGMLVLSYMPWDEKRHNAAVEGVERALKRLELALTTGENGGNGKCIVGTEITYADVMVGSVLLSAMTFLMDAKMRADFPACTSYALGLLELPEFKGVFGELKPVENRVSKSS